MCSQCSFQVVLRSLRFKQAKHLHGTKQELLLQHRSSRRSYVTAAIPQTHDPLPIEILKHKRRTPAHSPTQHLETWRPPPPPPLPTEVLEILQDNPFTSSDGIAKLLHSLASHPHAFSHVHEIVAPTIKGLLSVRHYAGARAVIERVLDGFLDRDKFRPVGKKELHTLIDAILGTDDFRRPSEFELHSLPAIRSILHLLLQYLVNFPEKFCILPVIVKTLVCVPEYLDLQSMPLFLHLYHEVINNYPAGDALGSNVPTMHNIMRVYALQGDSETAERWMQAILAARETKKQEQPEASKLTETSKSDASDLDRKAPSSKPFNRASSVLHLSTTYLSSLAQPKEVGLKISSIDSGDAMSLFQDLWDYSKHQHAPLENPVPDNLANMTVHAWSAIIHAAALDVNGIPSSRLLAALRSLQDSAELPNPNKVTYTAVLGGLNRRGDYAMVRDLFEHEIVPRAALHAHWARTDPERFQELVNNGKDLVIDAQLLNEVMQAWVGLRNVEMSARIVQYYGKLVHRSDQSARDPAPHEKTHHLAEPFASQIQSGREGRESTKTRVADDSEILRGTVKVDILLINQLITYFLKAKRFTEIYNLFSSMTELYGVHPDDVTLALLAKTALACASYEKYNRVRRFQEQFWPFYEVARRQIGSTADHYVAYRYTGRKQRHIGSDLDAMPVLGYLRGRKERWDGRKPFALVMQLFWDMLKENFDHSHRKAVANNMSVNTRGIWYSLGFGSGYPVARSNPDGNETEMSFETRRTLIDRYIYTSGLETAGPENKHHYKHPSLFPTTINMHLFVALSATFGRAHDIPLILSHMKALDLTPKHNTLCLAIWSYEASGVYSKELVKLHRWLGEWLGKDAVPSDADIVEWRFRGLSRDHREHTDDLPVEEEKESDLIPGIRN